MTALQAAIAQIIVASLAAAPQRRVDRPRFVRWLTPSVLVLLILCAVAQYIQPALLAVVERTPAAARGEVWRLVTSLWFQDGGPAGSALNLLMLAAIGWAAEAELSPAGWIGAYLAGGLAGGLAGLAWQPVGAGNSIATLGLAGAVFAVRTRHAAGPARAGALAGLTIGALLALFHDIHGAAVIAGAGCVLLGQGIVRRRQRAAEADRPA